MSFFLSASGLPVLMTGRPAFFLLAAMQGLTATPGFAAASILVMAGVTFLTRLVPFLIFGRKGRPPEAVVYLGRVLPPAIIAILVIYCLRNVDLFAGSHGLPELLCVAVVAILQLWKGNTLLSICGGTLLYMLLVQLVFA